MSYKITNRAYDGAVVAVLRFHEPDRILPEQANGIRENICAEILERRPRALLFDLENSWQIATPTLGIMLEIEKKLKLERVDTALLGVNNPTKEIIKQTNLTGRFQQYRTIDDAIEHYSSQP